MRTLFIVAYAVGIIIIGFSFAIESVLYSQTGSKRFNFLHNFPYELNSFKVDNKKSYLLLITELIGFISLAFSSLAFAMYYQNTNPTSAYIMFAVNLASCITFFILRFVKLTNYRGHLLTTSIYVVINLLLLLLYYFFFTNADYGYVFTTGVKVAEIIILLVLIIFEFFLMLNPSYKNWYKMVKIEAEVYSRPKYCYLTILEWGNLLIYALSFIPLIIVIFF
jgi:hypothetical protein